MAKRILSVLLLVLAAAVAAAQGKGNDKLTVCHFPESGDVQLLSVSRNALPAHLKHGDVEAPASVKTAADCLVPQQPPQPVAVTATADARGLASFTIPSTNIIARVTVTDSRGAPVAGAKTQMMVIGDDYLVIAVDESDRLFPGFAEGKLSDARPGSALQVTVNPVLHAPTSTLQGGAILQNPPPLPPPPFVVNHFPVTDTCLTQETFEQYLELSCSQTLGAGTDMLLAWSGAGTLLQVLASLVVSIPVDALCSDFAKQAAASAFAGATLPKNVRTYNPPGTLTPLVVPFYVTEIGTCGGSCCVAHGPQCQLVADAKACQGTYRAGTPCMATPCKTGACCEAAGCSVVSLTECNSRGGRYLGDNTVCTPNPCIKGACCDPKTGCSVVTDVECGTRGGRFHGPDTTCDRISGTTPLLYTLTSGGGEGGASFPIPFTHGTIKTKVTIPGNMVGNQCQRDWRVEIRVCVFGASCTGANFYAGQQFSICHANPETITFQQLNPPTPCSTYSVNALTAGVSQVEVEVVP